MKIESNQLCKEATCVRDTRILVNVRPLTISLRDRTLKGLLGQLSSLLHTEQPNLLAMLETYYLASL